VRIFGWAADGEGCGFYRLNLPLGTLAEQGLADTYVSEVWTLADSRTSQADVIVGQRVCKPAPSARWREWCAKPWGSRPLMVYEIDDHLLNVPGDNELAGVYYNTLSVQEEIKANVRAADMLTVSTPNLAAEFSKYTDAPIVVLQNRIPASLCNVELPTHAPEGKVIFGWAGSATHRGDFEKIGRMIARFGERNVDRVQLHMMGMNYLPRSFKGDVRHSLWVSGVTEYYRGVDFHVGLAPLVPNVFNACKSHIKALEYAALGIPVIASDVGPYSSFVENGITGLLIRSDHEWERAMRRLLEEDKSRVHMGENARKLARRHTIEEHARQWRDAYEWGIRNAV
jgi:glycosyltransferase involved in cell wall biosynthesis